MKKRYIILLGLLSLLTYSCIDKDENEFKPDLPQAEISGFEPSYSVFTHQDTLKISPSIADERKYSFMWTMYSTNFNVNAGQVPKPDTLAETKDLDYEVLVNPGAYILILNVKNLQTGVTKLVTSQLSVSTQTMNGWYLLKDDGQKTDFDFIYDGGRIDNWMANFNGGQSMTGKAIKSVFAESFKLGLSSTDLFNVLTVISDNDAAIFRIDNGKRVMDFENMFFTKPGTKKPENILQSMAGSLHLINNGEVYTMNKGALFAAPPPSAYRFSPVAAVAALDIAFDLNSRTIVPLDGQNFVTLGSTGEVLKNMNADVVWIGGYPGLRSAALALFRQASGDGLLVKMNANYPALAYNSGLVQGTQVLPSSHSLMSADVIGGNYDSDYIYYAVGNKIYVTDFASVPENLQITLPEGEEVTCIQHIKYPAPASGVTTTTDYLAIASYAAGKYKVWLHTISSIGTIQPLDAPDFEGQGKVRSINYLEQGKGSRTF